MDSDKTNGMRPDTDQQLLERFFAEARTPVPDDGFSQRVMQQIGALQAARRTAQRSSLSRLARWNFWLNFIAGLSIVVLLYVSGVFERTWMLLQTVAKRVVVGIITFDPDELLVQLMLFMHRAVGLLPSVPQLVAIVLSMMALMIFGVQRLARIEQSGR